MNNFREFQDAYIQVDESIGQTNEAKTSMNLGVQLVDVQAVRKLLDKYNIKHKFEDKKSKSGKIALTLDNDDYLKLVSKNVNLKTKIDKILKH